MRQLVTLHIIDFTMKNVRRSIYEAIGYSVKSPILKKMQNKIN